MAMRRRRRPSYPEAQTSGPWPSRSTIWPSAPTAETPPGPRVPARSRSVATDLGVDGAHLAGHRRPGVLRRDARAPRLAERPRQRRIGEQGDDAFGDLPGVAAQVSVAAVPDHG